MLILKELKYSKEHEWVKLEGNKAYIGITDFAQDSLGNIVFIELPEVNSEISEGDTLSVVESVKAASDVYSPVSGTILKVNEELANTPERLNEAPYESWIAFIDLVKTEELENLMDADAYEKFCAEEA